MADPHGDDVEGDQLSAVEREIFDAVFAAEIAADVSAQDGQHGQHGQQAAATRSFSGRDAYDFLAELQRDPGIATIHARNDFPYTAGNTLTEPLHEREYWLKLSKANLQNPSLAGQDGYAIMHVHYQGKYPDRDRAVITQINIRHAWHSGLPDSERFHKKCVDLDKWREKRGTCILGSREAPRGWRWRDAAHKNLTAVTPCLQELLLRGERCGRVVRKKYTDLVSSASSSSLSSGLSSSLSSGLSSSLISSASAGAAQSAQPAQPSQPSQPADAETAEYHEPDWSTRANPEQPPWPFTVLFVGVDSGEKTDPDLNLKEEFKKVKQALNSPSCHSHVKGNVHIEQLSFCRWGEVMEYIREYKPTVLQISSHSTNKKGVELFQQQVRQRQIFEAVRAWNEEAAEKGWPTIRVALYNSCESEALAKLLASCVDFTAGHVGEVADPDAVYFSFLFWSCVFGGGSLHRSFVQANAGTSFNYRLFAERSDPRKFRLVPGEFAASDSSDAQDAQESGSPVVLSAVRCPSSHAKTTTNTKSDKTLATEPSPEAGADSHATGADSGESEEYSVVPFLKKHGLKRVAVQLSEELGLEDESDLQYVTSQKLDEINCLKGVQREKLLKLCMQVSADGMSPSEDTERLSQASTPGLSKASSCAGSDDAAGSDAGPDAGSIAGSDAASHAGESARVVVAARNVGDCEDFQQHMRGLLQDFHSFVDIQEADAEWETFHVSLRNGPCVNWTLCMLLWVTFASEAKLETSVRESFKHVCRRPEQEAMMSSVSDCLLHQHTEHSQWNRAEFDALSCQKTHAPCIYWTDRMVAHHLSAPQSAPHKREWTDRIVQDWYSTDEDASEFLHRANRFLRDPAHSIDRMGILESVVETRSYVAVMRMEALSVRLFFGYLEAHRLDLVSRTDATDEPDEPDEPIAGLHGFHSFISSAGHVFTLNVADTPAQEGIVVEGLNCMARLGQAEWEALGGVKAAREFVMAPKPHEVSLEMVGKIETQKRVAFEVDSEVPIDSKTTPCLPTSADASGANTAAASQSVSQVASEAASLSTSQVASKVPSQSASQVTSALHSAQPSRPLSPRQSQQLHTRSQQVAPAAGLDFSKGSLLDTKSFGHFNDLLMAKLAKLPQTSSAAKEEELEQMLRDGTDLDTVDEEGLTALMRACLDGDGKVAAELLEKGATVDLQDENGMTALFFASLTGHKEVAAMLLEKGATVDLRRADGITALMIASQNGHKEVAALLLEEKASVDLQSKNGGTALILASLKGHKEVAALLLEEKASVDLQEENGITALMIASFQGHKEVAALLLEEKASVDLQSKNGGTALMSVSQNGHKEVAALLLEKKASVDLQDENGGTALMVASSNGHKEVAAVLLENKASVDMQDEDGDSALILASRNGHKEVAALLLEKKASVDMQDKNGWTALMWASLQGHKEVAALLLEKKASVDFQDKNGMSALFIASSSGHTEVAALLLEKKASVDFQDKNGMSALFIASSSGHTEVAALLLEKKASVDFQDKNGMSALFIASSSGHTEVAALLLEKKASVDFQDKNGMSALFIASSSGHKEVAALLLEKKASVDFQAKSGRTALMWASDKGHKEVAALLLANKASVDFQAKSGRTALMWASDKGHKEVAALLLANKASVDMQDLDGDSALMIASENGHLEVVKQLLEKGARIDLKAKNGNTALMVAKREGHHEVAKVLTSKLTTSKSTSSGFRFNPPESTVTFGVRSTSGSGGEFLCEQFSGFGVGDDEGGGSRAGGASDSDAGAATPARDSDAGAATPARRIVKARRSCKKKGDE